MISGEQFDMQSGWRKPPRTGVPQQGKLFHGGEKPPDEHRYQRGFTPERLHAVENLGFDTYVEDIASKHPWVQAARAQAKEPAHFRTHPEDLPFERKLRADFPSQDKRFNKEGITTAVRNRAIETIARSKVPIEDLQTSAVRASSAMRDNELVRTPGLLIAHDRPEEKRAGYYNIGTPTLYSDRLEHRPTVAMNQFDTADPDYTLMHELGHHNSTVTEQKHSVLRRRARGPVTAGREEAHADAYAQTHLVRPPGDERPVVSERAYDFSAYFGKGRLGPSQKALEASTVYHGAVGTKLGQMSGVDIDKHEGVWPPSPGSHEARQQWQQYHDAKQNPVTRLQRPQFDPHPNHQPHLYERSEDSYVTERVADYGQHPIKTWDGKQQVHIGTLQVGAGVPSEVQARTEQLREKSKNMTYDERYRR